jgi:hypothetical protein
MVGVNVRIDRIDLTQALDEFIAGGNGVVVGAPGSGKTHLLSALARRTRDGGRPLLFLPVDRAGIETASELRDFLGGSSDIVDYLRKFPPDHLSGVLIIDALDAARSERSRKFFLEIARTVTRLVPSWTVIMSVRSYDARRSAELEEIFPAAGGMAHAAAPFFDHGLRVRHIVVPPLTDDELAQAIEVTPTLATLYERGGDDLRRLMRNPFNLWLVERLVSDFADDERLTTARSEVELLDLFWHSRVDDRNALTKRVVLATITQAMVTERSLSLPLARVFDPALSDAWTELLSVEILEETDQARIAFRHNIIFDFAVSVLELPDEPRALVEYLSENPSRPVFLRPSLNYQLIRLWYRDRPIFWRIFWTLQEPHDPRVSLISRVVPSAVVVAESVSADDVSPLVDALLERRPEGPLAALRVLQALRTMRPVDDVLWAEVVRRLTACLNERFAWDVGVWVGEAVERLPSESEARLALGRAARALLAWSLERGADSPWVDRLGAVWGVPATARTFDTDPDATVDLLREVADLVGKSDRTVDYVYRLTESINALWTGAPELVISVFERVFAYVELSEEKTSMGGVVLALTSTRRQDFGMCRWNLIRQLPELLEASPAVGVAAVVRAANALVQIEHIAAYGVGDGASEWTFPFHGREVRMRADGSYIWDAPGTHDDEEQQLVRPMFEMLSSAPAETVDEALAFMAAEARVAFLWRRLLASGVESVGALAERLDELLTARGLAECNDTYYEYGRLLAARFESIDDASKGDVESLLLSLADREDDEEHEVDVIRQQQLASAIAAWVRDPRLRTIAEAATAPPLRPLTSFRSWSESYDETEWLRERGADMEDPANRELVEISGVLDDFDRKWINEVPSADAVGEVTPVLERCYMATWRSHEDAVDPAVGAAVWTKVASVAALVARAGGAIPSSTFELCRNILLAAAADSEPREESVSGDFSTPAWSPAPRIEAAQGLPWLAAARTDSEVQTAIAKLSTDPVRSVRYLTAQELFRVAAVAPELFWSVTSDRLAAEDVPVIVDALVNSLLRTSAPETEGRIVSLLAPRFVSEMERGVPSRGLRSAIASYAIARNEPQAITLFEQTLLRAAASPELLEAAMDDVLALFRPARLATDQGRAVLSRAAEYVARISGIATSELRMLNQASEADPERITPLYKAIDALVDRVYFGSGAFEGSADGRLSSESQSDYYAYYGPVVSEVLKSLSVTPKIALPASTAHRLVELHAHLLQIDPPAALAGVVDAAQLGQPAGYAFDSLAATAVVRFVERLLSDYRELTQQEPGLTQLVTLLDIFVETGWPDAQRMVWRLEEIFR